MRLYYFFTLIILSLHPNLLQAFDHPIFDFDELELIEQNNSGSWDSGGGLLAQDVSWFYLEKTYSLPRGDSNIYIYKNNLILTLIEGVSISDIPLATKTVFKDKKSLHLVHFILNQACFKSAPFSQVKFYTDKNNIFMYWDKKNAILSTKPIPPLHLHKITCSEVM